MGLEWQAVVLAVQIMLLAAGWLLFQRARGELSARAAEAPVLAELKDVHQQVRLLLVEVERSTERQAARLENGCADAVAVLTEIENKIRIAEQLLARSAQGNGAALANIERGQEDSRDDDTRDDQIYALADAGHSTAAIAHTLRLSEGEVEMLLGLRGRR